MDIRQIISSNVFKNRVLRERAVRAHCDKSLEFVCFLNDQEVGFLSYEDWPDRSQGFIYEIFVLPNFRRQGIGQSMLLHVEKYAMTQGRKTVRLRPYALDTDLDTCGLILWYTKTGYFQSNDEIGVYEKHLAI